MLVKVVRNSRGNSLCSEEEAILRFLSVYFALRENPILEVTIISSGIQPEMCFIVSQGKHRWYRNTKSRARAHTHTHHMHTQPTKLANAKYHCYFLGSNLKTLVCFRSNTEDT